MERLRPQALQTAEQLNQPRPDGRAYFPLSPFGGDGGLQVSLEDRWALIGMSGSGKTTFAQALVRRLRDLWPHASLYVADTSGKDDFDGWPGIVIQDDAPKALTGDGQTQVWRPSIDDASEYDRWLERILRGHNRHRPAIVLIDELSNIGGRTGLSYPVNFSRLMKMGRGLAICMIVCTQEAAYIPRQVLGQCSMLVRLHIEPGTDTERVDRKLWGHPSRAQMVPGKHGFHIRRIEAGDSPVLSFPSVGKLLAA